MKILITGAGGFVGQSLSRKILATYPADLELVLLDISDESFPEDERVTALTGSIAEDSIIQALREIKPDQVFHLASIPGGAAEKDYQLGLDVNLLATINILEALRDNGNTPRVVFASSIAVLGADLPSVVDETTAKNPALSYGTHKLIGEQLIADYSRKGFIEGVSVRLPGIVARPPKPSGLMSAFMSDIFWALKAGESFVCPVSEKAVAWWQSDKVVVKNLLHAVNVEVSTLHDSRAYTLPVLRLTMHEVIEGLAEVFGEDRKQLVTYDADATLEKIFGSYPELDASAALKAGFIHDGDVIQLVSRAVVEGCDS